MKYYILIFMFFLLNSVLNASSDDLRRKFRTDSIKAAQLIEQSAAHYVKNNEKAIQLADQALKHDPKCQFIYYLKGLIYNNVGKRDESLKCFLKAISLDKKDGSTTSLSATQAGLLQYFKKDYRDALEMFSKSIIADPGNKYDTHKENYRYMFVILKDHNENMSAVWAGSITNKISPQEDVQQDLMRLIKEKPGGYAKILFGVYDEIAKYEKRVNSTELSRIDNKKIKGDVISEKIDEFLTTGSADYIIALPENGSHYYHITWGQKEGFFNVTKIKTSAPVKCGVLDGGFLYLALTPDKVVKLKPDTGKTEKIYDFRSGVPDSIAVFSEEDLIFFPKGNIVFGRNLKTNKDFKTDIPGHLVKRHPQKPILLSAYTPADREVDLDNDFIHINGRPIFINRGLRSLPHPVTLYRALVKGDNLLPMELRYQVSFNGRRLVVSPDGDFVTATGRHKMEVEGKGLTTGLAVLSTGNINHLHNFMPSDNLFGEIAFNGITKQVSVMSEEKIYIYHISDNKKAFEIEGKFGDASIWSSNGKYFLAANNKRGISIFKNSLSAKEKSMKIPGIPKDNHLVIQPEVKTYAPIQALVKFTPKADKGSIQKLLKSAFSKVESKPLSRWENSSIYLKDEKLSALLKKIKFNISRRNTRGIAIYQAKKALKSYPDYPPLYYLLGEVYLLQKLHKEAEESLLNAVRKDRGRTDLTCYSLNLLGQLFVENKKDLSGMHCLAMCLFLDNAHPTPHKLLPPLLAKYGLSREKSLMEKHISVPIIKSSPKKHVIKKEIEVSKTKNNVNFTSDEIFEKAIKSVCLVKTSRGTGTGFYIGKGLFYTSHHIISRGGGIQVALFDLKNNKVVKKGLYKATVAYENAEKDVAILKVSDRNLDLKPLMLSKKLPKMGEKVYVIGNPGMGDEILTQSITDGIISSNNRKMGKNVYLQHSAPVNHGNSGGPVINKKCEVVGVVTLKAGLENVSFAIPSTELLELLKDID